MFCQIFLCAQGKLKGMLSVYVSISLWFSPTEREAAAEGSQRAVQLSEMAEEEAKRWKTVAASSFLDFPPASAAASLPLCGLQIQTLTSPTAISPRHWQCWNPPDSCSSPPLFATPPSCQALSVCWTEKKLGLQARMHAWHSSNDRSLWGQRLIWFARHGATSERPACERSRGVSGIHNSAGSQIRSVPSGCAGCWENHPSLWTVDVKSGGRRIQKLLFSGRLERKIPVHKIDLGWWNNLSLSVSFTVADPSVYQMCHVEPAGTVW